MVDACADVRGVQAAGLAAGQEQPTGRVLRRARSQLFAVWREFRAGA